MSTNLVPLSNNLYGEMVDGYLIVSAQIQDPSNIQVVLKESDAGEPDQSLKSDSDYLTRIISYVPNDLKKNDGFNKSQWKGVGDIKSVILIKEKKGVSLTDIFSVSEKGRPFEDISKPRSEWDDYTRRGNHLRMIGERAYAVGSLRKLFRRDGVGNWTDLTDPEQHPNLFKRLKFLKERDGGYSNSYAGFRDVDGFNETDIYAGGRRDLWRYDGERWHEIQLPQYPSISSVVCAKDDYVYVVGRNGPLLRGREDDWEVIDIPALDYNEMTWFDDKLWLASDYELGVYENGEYHRYEFPAGGPAQYSFNGVHSCDDMLLSYGLEQVLLFDGEEWVELIGSLSI